MTTNNNENIKEIFEEIITEVDEISLKYYVKFLNNYFANNYEDIKNIGFTFRKFNEIKNNLAEKTNALNSTQKELEIAKNEYSILQPKLAQAEYDLAVMYETGKGMPQDYNAAFKLFEKAANRNNFDAKYKLAEMYELGRGTTKNIHKSFELYSYAAYNGYPKAQYKLGYYSLYTEQNYIKARDWLQKAADQKNYDAIYEIGLMYKNGKGFLKDIDIAINYLIKSADKNHINSLNKLGNLYYWENDDIKQDYKKAFGYFIKAADLGDKNAQFRIGWMYESGEGTDKDYKKAVEYYEKAAEQGYMYAQSNLGYHYENGNGVTKNLEKAFELYKKAAEQGNNAAQYNLGLCYEYGKGTEKNIELAKEWYKKAADQNHERAIKALKQLG